MKHLSSLKLCGRMFVICYSLAPATSSTLMSLSNVYTSERWKNVDLKTKSKVSKNLNKSEFVDVLSNVYNTNFLGNWPIVFTATNLLLLYIGAVESQCQWTKWSTDKTFLANFFLLLCLPKKKATLCFQIFIYFFFGDKINLKNALTLV